MAEPAKAAESSSPDYDKDFCLWAERQATLLRAGDFEALDVENLIEEIEDMPQNNRRAVESNLVVVLKHLLKYQFQPGRRSGSWLSSIREHRRRIDGFLEDSPSLRPKLAARYPACYRNARSQATDETGLAVSVFPEDPEFDLADALDETFWPGPADR